MTITAIFGKLAGPVKPWTDLPVKIVIGEKGASMRLLS
jgi:hypothetical protein